MSFVERLHVSDLTVNILENTIVANCHITTIDNLNKIIQNINNCYLFCKKLKLNMKDSVFGCEIKVSYSLITNKYNNFNNFKKYLKQKIGKNVSILRSTLDVLRIRK